MAEPAKVKRARDKTGQEFLIYQHPDGSWKRTAPVSAPPDSTQDRTGMKFYSDDDASPLSRTLSAAGDSIAETASDLGSAVSRMDLTDKLFGPLGAALAQDVNPDLPINQATNVPPPATGSAVGDILVGNPLTTMRSPVAQSLRQDMTMREDRSPVATTVGDVAQAVPMMAAMPSAGAATMGGRVGLGALEGMGQGALAGAGAAVPGEEGYGALAGAGLGGTAGAAIPAMMSGLQGLGQYLYKGLQDPMKRGATATQIRTALAGGAEPSLTATGGIKPSLRMEADIRAADAIAPGSSGTEQAYNNMADFVLPQIKAHVDTTLNQAEAASQAAVAKYPNLRIPTDSIRNELNALLSRSVADITPEGAVAGVKRAAKVRGVEPYSDVASLSSEFDLPGSHAPELRSIVEKLQRQLPADENVTLGKALRGSGQERRLARINAPADSPFDAVTGKPAKPTSLPDLSDEAEMVPDDPLFRQAEFTAAELVRWRRILDAESKQATKLAKPELARDLGNLATHVRNKMPPEVQAASDAQHQALNAMEERLTQLGLPEASRDIVEGRGPQWTALRSKLAQDPLALRQALAFFGPQVEGEAKHAAGLKAVESLHGAAPAAEGTAEALSWKNPAARVMGAVSRLRPRVRGAALRNMPAQTPMGTVRGKEVSRPIANRAIVGMLPTFGDEEPPKP